MLEDIKPSIRPLKEVKETVHQLQDKCCNKKQDVREDLREAAHDAGEKVLKLFHFHGQAARS